jgi:hypothetical protein
MSLLVSGENLGCHEVGCADSSTMSSYFLFVFFDALCETEVRNFTGIVMEEDILRLEVSVDNVLVVKVGASIGDLSNFDI